MRSHCIRACSALALALVLPATSFAATDAELADIRDQIHQLKESYEARIQALEERLGKAESRPVENVVAPVAQPIAS